MLANTHCSEDNIEVGANLYEIDTEAEATVTASSDAPAAETAAETESSPPPPVAATEPAVSVPPAAAASEAHREPSIHFLGKDGWSRRLSGAPISLIPDKPNGVVVLDGSMLTSNYGRPAFTEAEMEALMMGGADIAPQVVSHSSGAMFAWTK